MKTNFWAAVLLIYSALIFVPGATSSEVGWTTAGINIGSTTNIVPSNSYPGVLYAGSAEGFYYSDNLGINWQKRCSGDFQFLLVVPTQPETIICGSENQFFRVSENQGMSWDMYECSLFFGIIDGKSGCFNPQNPNEVFIGGRDGIFRTVRVDGTWKTPQPVFGAFQSNYSFVDIGMFDDDPDVIYAASLNQGIIILHRQMDSWVQIIDPIMPPEFEKLESLLLDQAHGKIYCGSSYAQLSYTDVNFLNWTEILPPGHLDHLPLTNMIFTHDGSLIAEFESNVFKYREGTWSDLHSKVFPGVSYSSIMEMPNSFDLVVGSKYGCIYYNSRLNTWSVKNKGINGIHINDLCFHPHNHRMIVGTNGAGAFTLESNGQNCIQAIAGLPGFNVEVLKNDPVNHDKVYAVCSGTLALSTDFGAHWIQSGRVESMFLTNIATVLPFEYLNSQKVLIGLDSLSDQGSLIFLSSDGGYRFASCVTPDYGNGAITFFYQDRYNPQTILCGFSGVDGSGKIMRSDNGGESFYDSTPFLMAFNKFPVEIVQTSPTNMVLAVKNSGIYRKNGFTWEKTSNVSAQWNSMIYVPGNDSVICLTADDAYWPYTELYLSYDYGETWNWSNQFGRDIRTTVVADDSRLAQSRIILARRDSSFWESMDEAQSWHELGVDYQAITFSVNDIAFSHQNNNLIYMATEDNGVWKSTDAGWTWNEANVGLPETHYHVRTIDIDPRFPDDETHRLLIGCANEDDSDHRIYESLDSAGSWQRKDVGAGFNAKIVDLNIIELPEDNEDVWLATYGDGAWRSSDGGEQWLKQSFETDPPGQFLTSIAHTHYAQGSGEPWITASSHGGGGSFIWDPGQNQFRVRNQGLPGYTNNDVSIDLIAADPDRYGVFWAASDQGLYLTKDFCETWVPSLDIDGSAASRSQVRDSSISFNNGDVFYAQRGMGVYRSQDGLSSASWTEISNGLNQAEKDLLSIVEAVGSSSRRRLLGCPTGEPPLAYPISRTVKNTGADLKLSTPLVYGGDEFDLSVILSNSTDQSMDVGICVLLELYGEFYWWPSWGTEFDCEMMTLQPGQTPVDLLAFIWPEGAGTGEGTFYSGILDVIDGSLIGDLDWSIVGWM